MKILHTADLHLGQVMYQYYTRGDEHDHFFAQLRGWCRDYRPDALVVSGDVFDIPQPGAAVKEYFNSVFAGLHTEFPDIAIVVASGNHDSASRIEADSVVWRLSGVTLVGQGPAADVLQQPEGWQDRFIVELPTGFIVAVPFMPQSRREVMQALLDRVGRRNADGRPVVLMAHTAVADSDFTGHGDIGNLRTQDCSELGSGYDYLALGHIHRPQTIGHDLADESQPSSAYPSPVARYSGSALHVSCDEQYPHSVSLVEMDAHGGTVSVVRLRIDELRHFYLLPPSDREAARSAEEVYAAIDDFCATVGRGYIRLRVDHGAPLPADFIQTIYDKLEATGNEVRFNPKTIWEGAPQSDEGLQKPLFEVAELQQMTDPLEFVRRTIEQYPELKIDELEDDFVEIEKERREMAEAAVKPTKKSAKQ